jgi:D-xylose transport system substrate-binding protein
MEVLMPGFVRAIFWVFLLAVYAVCSPQTQAQSSPQPLKIGFLLDSLKVERWQTDLNAFQARAKELGAETLVETAEGDDELQYQQAKKLLDAGVKSLVVVPHDTTKAERIVAMAKERNVPVVSYDRLIRNSAIDLFVGVDVHEVGRLQAEYLTRLSPKGNYVLLGGSSNDVNAHVLREGQEEVIKPKVERGDIKIVGDVWCKDWSPLEAYTHVLEIISKTNGQIDAIVASNDGTATGALQALEENKLAGKVYMSGQDADLAAVLRLLQGTQTMTIYKPLQVQAARAAEAAVVLGNGQKPKSTSTILAGDHKVPAIFTSAIVLTKYNIMQTVIKDGFQNLDTIRKSLPPEQWPKD